MANEFTIQEQQQVWSSFGLNPQVFPQYYDMGPVDFVDSQGQPSGALGATATLTKSLSNPPHMLFGIRLRNVYPFPTLVNDDNLRLYEQLKNWVDNEQTVRITLAQQNPQTNGTMQELLVGHAGNNWHPFPVPFPMAGANDVLVEVKRITAYPAFTDGEIDEPVFPKVYATLITAVMQKGPGGSMGVERMHGG